MRRARLAQDSADALCDVLATLARRFRVGAVGLAGACAQGIAKRSDALEVFVACDLVKLEAFGQALAESTGRFVTLYDVRRTPWGHPLHLCVRWVNVDTLPRIECPERATALIRLPNGLEGRVRLDSVPHFVPVPNPRPPLPGGFARNFQAPPTGGFLL